MSGIPKNKHVEVAAKTKAKLSLDYIALSVRTGSLSPDKTRKGLSPKGNIEEAGIGI